LLDTDLGGLGADEVVGLVHEAEALYRQFAAVDQHLLAALSQQISAGQVPVRDAKTFLIEALQVSGRDAAARVAAAVDCGPRRTLTGQPLPPLFPVLAAAQAAGQVSVEQARVIRTAVEALPAELQAEHAPAVEATLIGWAGQFEPRRLTQLAGRVLATLYPDGPEPAESVHHRNRWATLRVNPDRSADLPAHLTPPVAAQVKAVLDALSKPRSEHNRPDPRTAGQRTHDAIGELCGRLLRSGTLPASGGTPTTVLLTMTLDQLQTQVTDALQSSPSPAATPGLVATAGGIELTISELLQIAGEAALIPVVTDTDGVVLNLGRTQRLANTDQRYALTIRDRGCTFPGCTTPPHWSEVHHVRPWLPHGPTDLNNLVLLCPHHHHNFERWDWQLLMKSGQPWWIPPTWKDPSRTPVQNTAHHLPIVFESTSKGNEELNE
jgi:hypothetical protein